MDKKQKKKSKNKVTDKEQSERFKQTARELGVESNQDFAQVLKKVAPFKQK